MSTTQTNIPEPGTSVGTGEAGKAHWIVACLMAGVPVEIPSDGRLREPYQSIIDAIVPLAPRDRLLPAREKLVDFLGSEEEAEATLERIFALNPRRPFPASTDLNSFPSPPLYRGKREINAPEGPLSHSASQTSTPPNSFQDACDVETKSGVLTPVIISDFLRVEDPPQVWCVERIFPMEGVGILASPGGWGKSWMLLDLGIETARGGRWLGRFATQRLRVLYIDEESSAPLLRRRLRKLLRGKGITADELDIHFAVGQGFSLSNPRAVGRLRQLLLDLQPGLVIMDSLIRIHDADENSATEMARMFAGLKSLVRLSKAAFVIADHQRKPGQGEVSLDVLLRGSSEKKNFVESLLSMKRKDKDLIVEHSKSRSEVELPSFVVRIEDTESGGTVVRSIGDADAIKSAEIREEVSAFLDGAIPPGDGWVARKVLIEQGKLAKLTQKQIDAALKAGVERQELTRDEFKPSGGQGRGRKQAHYRRKRQGNSFPAADLLETNPGEGS